MERKAFATGESFCFSFSFHHLSGQHLRSMHPPFLYLSISISISLMGLAADYSVSVKVPAKSSSKEVLPAQVLLISLSGHQQAVLLQVWGNWYLLTPH